MDVAKKYSQDELSKMPEMCAFLTELFERDTFKDHLGSIYMETFGGNKNLGQCFTPVSVCECMAGTAVRESIGEREFIRMADPACGGGATLIAACGEMHSKGFDYQRRCEIEAADLDSLCVDMCFIQLSLIGARARVMHMDSLSGKCFGVYETPMMCFGPVL
jgi:type I restriction-modification system DNA methylase subunit